MGVTRRLYYDDCYLREFDAALVRIAENPLRVYLDQTAFYPSSGGQPNDLGDLGGARVVNVADEDGEIAHLIEGPTPVGSARGRIDWDRRFDFMQQHTGQHLLSAVFQEALGAATLSVHFGDAVSTLDLAVPSLDPDQVVVVERRANRVVCENRPVVIGYDDAGADLGLRKPSERTGRLRIVTIDGVDRSACGGTHVRATGEIGPIFVRHLDKIRGNVRVEFVCGARAISQARTEFEALSRTARVLSCPLAETPALVQSQVERLAGAERQRTKLAIELAAFRGRELYALAEPGPNGIRLHQREIGGALTDEVRAEAQAFVCGERAVFLALSSNPPTVLLAVSSGVSFHAGETLKTLLAEHRGRGGGNAVIAQGSLPSPEAARSVAAAVRARVG